MFYHEHLPGAESTSRVVRQQLGFSQAKARVRGVYLFHCDLTSDSDMLSDDTETVYVSRINAAGASGS